MLDKTLGRRVLSVVGVARRMKLMPFLSAGRHNSLSISGGRSTTMRPSMPTSSAVWRKLSVPYW